MADLRHLLAIYVHAHQTGNAVPPHIDADARAALAAEPPAPAPSADGEREELTDRLGWIAAQLSDIGWGDDSASVARAAALLRQPAPAPAVDGEREELAALIEQTADSHNGLWPGPIIGKLYRAAALLRQLPPEGVEAIRYCVEEDGAVIQRTSRAPESWAIRAGSSCMSTTGEWDIEPMPSERTDEWLANHRWPSAAAAWAALQQARQQEVGDD